MRVAALSIAVASLCLASCDETTGSGTLQPDATPDAFTPLDDGAPPAEDADVPDAQDVGIEPVDGGPPPPEDAAPPSVGCGSTPGPNDSAWTLSHQARDRVFRVHLPPGYDPAVPTPVVLNYHGRQSNAQQQIYLSKMIEVANGEGFIVVHPEGIGGTWNAGLCCGEAMNADIDDVGFTRAMLDALDANLCIDARRVYATGLSNGAYMAHRLACELADRIAAIGSVAGTNAFLACSPVRPVPVYHFHGTADTVVPYDGFGGYTSVPSTMQYWVTRNGCNPASQVFFAQNEVYCEEWTGCVDDATVRLCTIDGGGHQWPGGMTIPFLGENTDVISASMELWWFFAAHPRP